jgi:hypothetical protein
MIAAVAGFLRLLCCWTFSKVTGIKRRIGLPKRTSVEQPSVLSSAVTVASEQRGHVSWRSDMSRLQWLDEAEGQTLTSPTQWIHSGSLQLKMHERNRDSVTDGCFQGTRLDIQGAELIQVHTTENENVASPTTKEKMMVVFRSETDKVWEDLDTNVPEILADSKFEDEDNYGSLQMEIQIIPKIDREVREEYKHQLNTNENIVQCNDFKVLGEVVTSRGPADLLWETTLPEILSDSEYQDNDKNG